MKKISLLLAIILSLMILVTGCAGKSANMEASPMAPMAPSMPSTPSEPAAPMPDLEMGGLKETPSDSYGSTNDIYNSESNKIIRTANLTIQALDFDATIDALNRLTDASGGYYEIAEVNSGGYYNTYANRSAYYVVRVPKENFIVFRDGISGIGHLLSINESTQDVGEQYYDTEARLATLTTKRDRLLALLEKAELMEDIISLESALADVQYDIDRHTSTLRKYDSLIGFSTFYIYINEVVKVTEVPSVKESFGSRFMSSLKKGFENFGEGVQDFAIWFARNLIGIIIFIAVVVVVIVFGRRAIRRRRARKHQD